MSKSMTTVKGRADMREAVCNASSPPENNSTLAIAAINTPHITFNRL